MLNRLPPPAARALLSWQERLNHHWQHHVLSRWHTLKRFQKLYVIATLSLTISPLLAVALTLVALIVDFWPRFARMWETLAGKAFVLIFYAATTNFALASAASLVNDVTGLDATYFPYSHYTAILLSLPGWIFGISIVALVLLQLLFPFYILAVLGLRMIGIRSTQIFKAIQYPVLTMCLRFTLSLLLVIKAVAFVSDEDANDAPDIATEEAIAAAMQPQDSTTKSEPWGDSDEDIRINFDSGGLRLMEGGYSAKIRQLTAHFIFYFEADSKSRCALSDKARSVELNTYQHVEISKNKSQPEGYQFIVKACRSPGVPTG